VEGYVESIATGLIAGINAARLVQGKEPSVAPRATACGSLLHYISCAAPEHFQPANISFGLLAEATEETRNIRDRKMRHQIQVSGALEEMERWIQSLMETILTRDDS